uniref:AAA+ ATPase domain-containing protein n=1 Tax=Arcella intermedia TaxID=1963864 RepID=A0A6B2KXZ2_9EUKA
MRSGVVKARKEYYDTYNKLISLEMEAEMNEVNDRLQNWTLSKLMREGIALVNLKGEAINHVLGEFVLSFRSASQVDLPFNRFITGDTVLITDKSNKRYEGVFHSVTKQLLKVSCNSTIEGFVGGIWRIDKGVNCHSYQRMQEALSTFTSNQPEASDYQREWNKRDNIKAEYLPPIGKQSPFKNIIIDSIKEAEKYAKEPSILQPLHKQDIIDQKLSKCLLNPSQTDTIKQVIRRKLSLVQGPPGTGKTHTAIQLLCILVSLYAKENISILASAYTNVATDNLLEGLRDNGINALRIGKPVKVREELRDATLQAHLERHPDQKKLERLRQQIKEMKGMERACQDKIKEIKQIESGILSDIIANAKVICCTCIGAGDPLLLDQYFPLVVIDESTQAVEPASLIPLTKGAQQVIFLGDHYQLPPTVKNDQAAKLKESLFHRLISQGNIKPFVLTAQYRMHPMISEFPCLYFYHGQISNAISEKDRVVPKGFSWIDSKPIIMIHTDGPEITTDSNSKQNFKEANIVTSIVRNFLVANELSKSDIGIITPYSGQVNLLTSLFSSDPLFTTFTERDYVEVGEDARTQIAGGLNVASVDGFQGREKEVIIFSAVRSNKEGQVGFLSDWRRLNVALTRAKRGLIVVGNAHTLMKDPHWHQWLSWAQRNSLLVEYSAQALEGYEPYNMKVIPSVAFAPKGTAKHLQSKLELKNTKEAKDKVPEVIEKEEELKSLIIPRDEDQKVEMEKVVVGGSTELKVEKEMIGGQKSVKEIEIEVEDEDQKSDKEIEIFIEEDEEKLPDNEVVNQTPQNQTDIEEVDLFN